MADLLVDGCMDFLGGQDSSKIPDRIAENAISAGVNITFKRGPISPRWGVDKKDNAFEDGVVEDNYQREQTYRSIFESGKFQAATAYYIGSQQFVLTVISGIIFLWNPLTNKVTVVPIADGSHINSRAKRINFAAAGKYMVLFDYPAFPVIVEGIAARRATTAAMEIPVSTIGAFNQNRLFVANNGNEFTGGDPVGSTAAPKAPITFKEVLTIASPYFGQIFQVPTNDHADPITFMGFLQVVDTGTGVGPLIIGTNRAIYTFNTQAPRAGWDTTQFGSLACYNAGIVGPRAMVNVNSDAFFLSNDGYVRSLSMSRNEQKSWSRVPISREVENWFKYWDRSLASVSFAGAFNNKVFFSVNPYRTAATDRTTGLPISDYAHGGLAVLELDNLTSFGEASKPTWAGLWTPCRPMEMISFGTRAFIIAKDSGVNSIYEIDPTVTYDTYKSSTRFVRSKVYTREHDFKDPFLNKELHSLDLNFDSLQGDFSIDVAYKPSHSAYFIPWKKFEHFAPWRTCDIPEGCLIQGYAPQHVRDVTLGATDTMECSAVSGEALKVFRKVQLQFTLKGKYYEIHEYRIKSMTRLNNLLQNNCEPLPVVSLCTQCEDDWSIEPFESCEVTTT